uniref:Uncharacterized protein n=1 Tax=Mycetohabitans sp. TaxID=2571162 RepID=A0A6B9HDQ5_9BURK|nr:hypothetical protein [Mycetohabitans sp.]
MAKKLLLAELQPRVFTHVACKQNCVAAVWETPLCIECWMGDGLVR